MMKLYRAYFRHDDEWQTLAVAHTAKEAKRLAWPVLESMIGRNSSENFNEVRICIRADIEVPPEITEPMIFDTCEPWNCAAWTYDADGCRRCALRDEKAAKADAEEWY